jgi:Fe-S-cluster containining protein
MPNSETSVNHEAIKLNKDRAFQGRLGQKREAFCLAYIKKKKEIILSYRTDQLGAITCAGEKISCREGCTYCCMAYMQASVQECEAIVHYLYRHEDSLTCFLANYPAWRKKLKDNRDIFQECGQLWRESRQPGAGESAQQALLDALRRYRQQEILCPFLAKGACTIYEVRPFTCVALVAVTPPENCQPGKAGQAKTYLTPTPEVFDTAFYYKNMKEPFLAFMPLAVYNLLVHGYILLENIPGLEGIEKAAKRK